MKKISSKSIRHMIRSCVKNQDSSSKHQGGNISNGFNLVINRYQVRHFSKLANQFDSESFMSPGTINNAHKLG